MATREEALASQLTPAQTRLLYEVTFLREYLAALETAIYNEAIDSRARGTDAARNAAEGAKQFQRGVAEYLRAEAKKCEEAV